jgi:uncharacterized protein (DUF1778 family)
MSIAKPGSRKKTESIRNKSERTKTKAYARFDARLTREQKDLFEKAASIKGFKSLSEFVIYYTSEAANLIVEKNNQILNSAQDQEIFFNALLHPPKPNAALLKAAEQYKYKVSAK